MSLTPWPIFANAALTAFQRCLSLWCVETNQLAKAQFSGLLPKFLFREITSEYGEGKAKTKFRRYGSYPVKLRWDRINGQHKEELVSSGQLTCKNIVILDARATKLEEAKVQQMKKRGIISALWIFIPSLFTK
jgi:hypothetical protein